MGSPTCLALVRPHAELGIYTQREVLMKNSGFFQKKGALKLCA